MSTQNAVIFDNDGIIVETEPLHYEARRAELEQYGIALTVEDYVRDWMSRHISVGLKVTWRKHKQGDANFSEIATDIQSRNDDLSARRLRLVTGFYEMFSRLKSDFVFAVASTQHHTSVRDGLLRTLPDELYDLFKVISSGESVHRNKPAPDVYLVTAQQLGIEPHLCVAFEDSVPGVQSAKSAGMKCVGRANLFTRRSTLLSAGADMVCGSYEEITVESLNRLLAH